MSGDFDQIVDIVSAMHSDYRKEQSMWAGSPFEWLQGLSSAKKGSKGEEIVREWALEQGFQVGNRVNSEHDCIINGHRIEVKYSNLWSGGFYKFQQIRNQQYDYCFCLGISPHAVHAWLIPKAALFRGNKAGLQHQHGGSGGQDTSWLTIFPDDPPQWLHAYGSTFTKVRDLLTQAGQGKY